MLNAQHSRAFPARIRDGEIFMSADDYNANSVDSKLTRIEGKLDALSEKRLDHEGRIAALVTRVERLEQFAWKLAGGLALGVFALNYFKK